MNRSVLKIFFVAEIVPVVVADKTINVNGIYVYVGASEGDVVVVLPHVLFLFGVQEKMSCIPTIRRAVIVNAVFPR